MTEPAPYRDPLLALNDNKVQDPQGFKLRSDYSLKIFIALLSNVGAPVKSVPEVQTLVNQAVMTTDQLLRRLAETGVR